MKIVGGRGYALELRERIVKAVEKGKSYEEVAQLFSVHWSTVKRYVGLQSTGELGVYHRSTGRPRRVTEAHENILLGQVKSQPEATLMEHAKMFESATGMKISFKTVDRVFARHEITHKKNADRTGAKRGTSDEVPERA